MARTYARDARGRFASGGGGRGRSRPPARSISRGPNRLTRDNSGRITSVGGNGATARGGRLRTASGAQRGKQTVRLGTPRPAGVVGGKVKRAQKPAASPMVRGNFRPRNTMGRSGKSSLRFTSDPSQNAAVLAGVAKRNGASLQLVSFNQKQLRSGTKAYVLADKNGATHPVIYMNKAAKYLQYPQAIAKRDRRSGQLATARPEGIVLHEIGHIRAGNKPGTFKGTDSVLKRRGANQPPTQDLAKRVSKYAATNKHEFAAETFSGLRTGSKYDHQVMRAYRVAMGLPPIRTGSRVKPGAAAIANPGAVSRDRRRRRRAN